MDGSKLARAAVASAVVAMLFRAVTQSAPADLDMFHQMALIREAVRTGALPLDDPFSYTSTVRPFIHHEWGAGAILYAITLGLGLGATGVVALKYLLVASLAFCAYRCARLRGAEGAALAITAPVAALLLAVGMATLRAQLYTFAAVAAFLLVLELHRRGTRWWLMSLPPIYLLWLNLHGGFVVGLGLFGVYLAEQLTRSRSAEASLRIALRRHTDLIGVFTALLVLPFVNPYGVEYIRVVFDALLVDRSMVAEWAPFWDSRVPFFVRFGFVSSLPFLLYALGRGGVRRLEQLSMVVVAMLAALSAQRLFPVYAIVWFAYVPGYLTGTSVLELIRRVFHRHRTSVAVGAAALAIGLSAQAVSLQPWRLRIPPTASAAGQIHYPVGAVEYLAEQGFSGNLMTPFDAGSFVSWKLYPAVRVGMDSRYEAVYTPESVDENFRLYSGGAGWQELLDRPDTDAVLVPVVSGLATQLAVATSGSSWRPVYEDSGYRIYVRSDSPVILPLETRVGFEQMGAFP